MVGELPVDFETILCRSFIMIVFYRRGHESRVSNVYATSIGFSSNLFLVGAKCLLRRRDVMKPYRGTGGHIF